MKKTPLVDALPQVHIGLGPLAGTDVLICDTPPDSFKTALPTGTIAIRRRGGYTTHLSRRGEHSRAWYALPSDLVAEVATYLRRWHPDTYDLIEWWGS